MHSTTDHTTVIGTAAGTGLTIIANIGSQDIVKTAILAGVGAFVSLITTITLKWVFKQFKKNAG